MGLFIVYLVCHRGVITSVHTTLALFCCFLQQRLEPLSERGQSTSTDSGRPDICGPGDGARSMAGSVELSG